MNYFIITVISAIGLTVLQAMTQWMRTASQMDARVQISHCFLCCMKEVKSWVHNSLMHIAIRTVEVVRNICMFFFQGGVIHWLCMAVYWDLV